MPYGCSTAGSWSSGRKVTRVKIKLNNQNISCYIAMSTPTVNRIANITKKKGTALQQQKAPKIDYKLSDDMLNEIKECFSFYDPDNTDRVNRTQFKSILANFGFQGRSSKEIEEELKDDIDPGKQSFSFPDIERVITQRWLSLSFA